MVRCIPAESSPDQARTVEEKIALLRKLFADAPEVGTKIPDFLDIIDSAWDGWPGIRSPEAKDYLAKYQITAEGWYVANDLTVAETRRLRRLGEAVDEFLDKVGN